MNKVIPIPTVAWLLARLLLEHKIYEVYLDFDPDCHSQSNHGNQLTQGEYVDPTHGSGS